MLPDGHLREALTFDDVLLVPAESDVIPKDVDVHDAADRRASALRIPIVSSAMDTVTEAAHRDRMAREGGIGIIHKNLSIAEQALEVTKVKKAETGVVVDPVTIGPDQKLADGARADARATRSPGCRWSAADGRPVGILTNRDVRFERNLDQPVSAMMTKQADHRRRGDDAGGGQGAAAQEPDREAAGRRRRRHAQGPDHHQGHREGAAAPARGQGRPRPAARRRARSASAPIATSASTALLAAGCDVICVDTAHGHSRGVVQAVADVRKQLPQGRSSSPATSPPARARWRCRRPASTRSRSASGPGSICTTRVVAGVGVPQITAIADCAKALAATNDDPDHRRRRHQVLGRRRQGDRRRRAHA